MLSFCRLSKKTLLLFTLFMLLLVFHFQGCGDGFNLRAVFSMKDVMGIMTPDSMLRACMLSEGGHSSARAIPILPTSALVYTPAYPNWPAFLSGPCVVRNDVLQSNITPIFSVLVNVWNREQQLRTTLVQLLKLTREPWELVVFVDGATDGSLVVANNVLDGLLRGWPACNTTSEAVAATANDVWPSGTKEEAVGNVGIACHLDDAPPLSLVRTLVLTMPKASMQETFANNLKMRVASATQKPPSFFVFVQDDQFMTLPGWNTWLAHPLRTYADVFSVSARCAHGFPEYDTLFGAKCSNSIALQESLSAGAPAGYWTFRVADSGNRGPLILRASTARMLGFLDEIHFAGVWTDGDDDHELNVRAFGYGAWTPHRFVSGVLPIPYTEERCCRSPETTDAAQTSALVRQWWQERRALAPARAFWNTSNTHNEIRFLVALNLSYRR